MSVTNPLSVTALNWTTNYLNKLEVGTVVVLAELKAKNPALLITCIKQYIDWYGGVDFNSDYTKFRRLSNV